MTGRFHKSWADFGGLRTTASLMYDCVQALAHGGGCSVGDQLHPSGVIDRGVYDVIGQVYRHVEKCEPWCRDVAATNEIAVLLSTPVSERNGNQCFDGITKALSQLRYQFAFIDPDADWSSYAVVIVPESLIVTPELDQRLAAYMAAGGKVIRDGVPGRNRPSPQSICVSMPRSAAHWPTRCMSFTSEATGSFPRPETRCSPVSSSHTSSGAGRILLPCADAERPGNLAVRRRCSARQRSALCPAVFRAYSLHGNLPCRQLVAAALERLLPAPAVRVKGPSYVEVTVGTRGKETILHFLSYIPQKRAATQEMVEDAAAARNLAIDVKVNGPVASVKRIIDGGKSRSPRKMAE